MSVITSSFKFPAIYNFPPFFTKQPNQRAHESQLRNWSELIRRYCKQNKIWIIHNSGRAISQGAITSSETSTDTTPEPLDDNGEDDKNSIFYNKTINRHLKIEFIQEIFEYMVKKNQASWYNVDILNSFQKKSSSKNHIVVYWKTPEDWGQLILDFVESSGVSGDILTFYELTCGELVTGQEFFGLHPFLMNKAIQSLVDQNRAQVLKDENGAVAGVKII